MSGKQLNINFGIDPTGPKIHLGRATILIKLRDFQNLGHKVTLIIGDFTALIGDASDKTAIRKPLTEEEVKIILKIIFHKIGMILDMNKVEVRHNKEWLGKMKGELVSLCMNLQLADGPKKKLQRKMGRREINRIARTFVSDIPGLRLGCHQVRSGAWRL